MATVLFSAMRNEAPFLLDWVAYHRTIGFERIVIVANDCDDGSYGLLEALAQEGVVEFHIQSVPRGISPQRAAVALADKNNLLKVDDWAIFLDADEYLNIAVGCGTVNDLADYLLTRNLLGMLINWKIFGDNGHASFPGSYIAEDYCRCESGSKRTQFKTFFRMGETATGFSGELHRCKLTPGSANLDQFITGSGKTIGAARRRWIRRPHIRWTELGEWSVSSLDPSELGSDVAQINHYMVRDPASFRLKQSRGRGHVPRRTSNKRHTASFYDIHNRNESVDRTILRWSEGTLAMKQELLVSASVMKAQKEVERAYADAIEAVTERDTVESAEK